MTEREKPNVKQTLSVAYNTMLAPNVKTCIDAAPSLGDNMRFVKTRENAHGITSGIATWFSQLCILLHRLLKERRHESFDALRVFQVIASSLLSGLMWWHSDYRDVHVSTQTLLIIYKQKNKTYCCMVWCFLTLCFVTGPTRTTLLHIHFLGGNSVI